MTYMYRVGETRKTRTDRIPSHWSLLSTMHQKALIYRELRKIEVEDPEELSIKYR